MATSCRTCDQPVHEEIVVCPHCGGRTGAAPDATVTPEQRAARIELAMGPSSEPGPLSSALNHAPVEATALGYVALGIGGLVKAAVETVIEHTSEKRPTLPRAQAHERLSEPVEPVEPIESAAPEPAPPPADQPRFLK